MHSFPMLFVQLLATSPLFAAATQTCPGGLYAAVASKLTSYAPAKSYCSSKYPLAPVTVTATASTSTIYTTGATQTQTSITGTDTITVTAPTTTFATTAVIPTTIIAATEADGTTIYVTQTISVNYAKRAAATPTTSKTTTTQNAQASAFSSLLSVAGSFVSTACVCIEGAPPTVTTTSTPRTTVSVTSTTVQNAAAATTTMTTPSTLITVTIITTIPATTTTVTTATSTTTTSVAGRHTCAISPAPFAAPEYYCNDGSLATYVAYACYVEDINGCDNDCENDDNCEVAQFQNNDCVLYHTGPAC